MFCRISIKKQIADIELGIKNAEVTAPIDSMINMYANLSKADLVQSGQTIALGQADILYDKLCLIEEGIHISAD